MIGNGSFTSFGPNGEQSQFQNRMFIAHTAELNERNSLEMMLKRIGVVTTYTGEDVHTALLAAIERYSKAVAHAEMLRILSTEDFFIAMSHSASKVAENRP